MNRLFNKLLTDVLVKSNHTVAELVLLINGNYKAIASANIKDSNFKGSEWNNKFLDKLNRCLQGNVLLDHNIEENELLSDFLEESKLKFSFTEHLVVDEQFGSIFLVLFRNIDSAVADYSAIDGLEGEFDLISIALADWIEIQNTREEDDHIRNALMNLESVIFSSDPTGDHYYYVSPGIERIVGISAQKAVLDKARLLRIIDKEDFAKFFEFSKLLRSGQAASVEYKILNYRGEELYIRHSGFPIFDRDRIVRIDGIIYNITQEKFHRSMFQRVENQLRTLFETAEDLIFILDAAGNFVFVNSNGALSLEYLPEEIIGKHFIDFVADEEKHKSNKKLRELLRTNSLVTFEVNLLTKYGKNYVFEINSKATYTKGKFDSVLGIGRNVTNRKNDEVRLADLNSKLIEANRIISIERDREKQKISVLEELNNLKSEFVSNISHELRTPLASILGFSETIDSDPEMPSEMRNEFVSIILNEARRLSRLINDILEISQLEGGKTQLNRTETDVVELLKPIIDKYQELAFKKSIVLNHELPEEGMVLNIDKERIESVFDNVINNALKFTKPGGRITIYARNFYKEFELIVSDTGIGIPKGDIPYLFQKFYRVSRADQTIPGSGLGLALAKQIVDLHKGFITIQSEEEKGTTVIVKLPMMKRPGKI